MDKKRSILNVGISITFKFILLVGSILVRRYLIRYIGNEVNGLNSLYLSIVGFLSVAELGVGSAITFCMYKPIVEKNYTQVAALYQLFKKAYWIIGAAIFAVGLLLLPMIPSLAKDYSTVDANLYGTFFLMLVSVVLSYLFSAKTSLINAYKDDYITTAISSMGLLLQYVLQIIVLVLTQSFAWYLGCRIIAVLCQWLVTEVVTRFKHKEIIGYDKQLLDADAKTEVTKNVKALFMHRIGGVLVNSSDSIIISAFIGVAMLGNFSNYTTIATAMAAVISLFFSPLTSIIGHMYVANQEQTKQYFRFFYIFNYLLGLVFFLGYYAVIDNLVEMLFGNNLELSRTVSFVITVNYFVQFLRQSTLLFRDATGTFYNDRWKPLLEGLMNIVLSTLLVIVLSSSFGEEIGLVGVIVATIITNLLICHIVEPYVLYKYAFKASPTKHILLNYICIAIFVVLLLLEEACLQSFSSQWTEFLVNAGISLLISGSISAVVVACDKNFRHYCRAFLFKK